MNITDEMGAKSENEVRRVFDEMSALLGKNGGEYLMDTPSKKYGFTAADLTLSALVYFLIRPPEMNAMSILDEEIPPNVLELGNELRETPAGKHVLKMYKLHRPVDQATSELALKKVNQDRIPWLEVAGATTVIIGAVILGAMSVMEGGTLTQRSSVRQVV